MTFSAVTRTNSIAKPTIKQINELQAPKHNNLFSVADVGQGKNDENSCPQEFPRQDNKIAGKGFQ